MPPTYAMQAETKVRYISITFFALLFVGMAAVMLTIVTPPDSWVLAGIVMGTCAVMLVRKHARYFTAKTANRM